MPKENIDLKQFIKNHQSLSAALTQQIFLRDILLLITTATNQYDRDIVNKLIRGEPLDDGCWTHIFEEAAKLKELPEAHAKTLQSIFAELDRKRRSKTEPA